jgi:hypothetical protein
MFAPGDKVQTRPATRQGAPYILAWEVIDDDGDMAVITGPLTRGREWPIPSRLLLPAQPDPPGYKIPASWENAMFRLTNPTGAEEVRRMLEKSRPPLTASEVARIKADAYARVRAAHDKERSRT